MGDPIHRDGSILCCPPIISSKFHMTRNLSLYTCSRWGKWTPFFYYTVYQNPPSLYFLVYMTTRVFTYCVRHNISHTDESLHMIIIHPSIRRKNLSSIIVAVFLKMIIRLTSTVTPSTGNTCIGGWSRWT